MPAISIASKTRWSRCWWIATPWASSAPRAMWPGAWRSMVAKPPISTYCSPNTGSTPGPRHRGPPSRPWRPKTARTSLNSRPCCWSPGQVRRPPACQPWAWSKGKGAGPYGCTARPSASATPQAAPSTSGCGSRPMPSAWGGNGCPCSVLPWLRPAPSRWAKPRRPSR